METPSKEYPIQLDTKIKITNDPMTLVQGDINSNIFNITLTENNEPIDLTDATVTITMKKADNNVVVGNCTIIDALNGKVKYTCGTNEMSYPGTVTFTSEIFVNGTRTTTNKDKFKVIAELDNGETAPSTTEYGVLSGLIITVNAGENARTTNENARIAGEEARTSNESARVTSENTRISNENIRIANETARVATFENMQHVDANTEVLAARGTYDSLNNRLEGDFNNLAGDGRTTETIKVNADAIKVNADDIANHISDSLYQTAGGTATAITLTINESLVNGFPINFICSYNNGGSATTVNTIPLYKPGTMTPPTLKAGKAYNAIYNSSGSCFFIKASATGTATPAQVLANVPYSNEDDTDLVGEMSNLSGSSLGNGTPTNGIVGDNKFDFDILLPSTGYITTATKVHQTLTNLIPSNLVSGVTIPEIAITGTMPPSWVSPGTTMWFQNSTQKTTSSSSMVKLKEVQLSNVAGTVRVEFFAGIQNGSNVGSFQIYKNDVPVGTLRTGVANATFTEDIAFSSGDKLSIYGLTGNTSYYAYVNYIYLKVATIPATQTLLA